MKKQKLLISFAAIVAIALSSCGKSSEVRPISTFEPISSETSTEASVEETSTIVESSSVEQKETTIVSITSVLINSTSYKEGEKIDLSNVKAEIVDSDGSEIKVSYANFAKYGLAAKLLDSNNKSFDIAGELVEGQYTLIVYVASNENVKKEVNITVISESKPETITGLTLNYSTLDLTVGDKIVLKVTGVTPSNLTIPEVSWSSDNSAVASVDGNGNVEAKAKGSAKITAKYNDVTASVSITVKAKQSTESGWQLVSDELNIGDTVVFASSSKGKVASSTITGSSSAKYLSPVDASFSSNKDSITSLPDSAAIFTVEDGEDGYFAFKNSDGKYLGSTGVKKLAWESSLDTVWDVSITSDNATISDSYGKILYNASSPRFTTYSSEPNTSMLLPQIYRGQAGDPIYPTSISISGSDTLNIGATQTLTLNCSPNNANKKEVLWSSSNTSVATVTNKGLVEAKAKGTTVITAKAKANENDSAYSLTATFNLTVKAVSVDSVELNETSFVVRPGKTKELISTVSPANASDKSCKFVSSDPSIATVDNRGVVEGISAGKATITCTTYDGNKTASCEVSVENTPRADYTIMLYISGNDLESGSSYLEEGYTLDEIEDYIYAASKDIGEILSVKNKPSGVNIIIQTGGAKTWSSQYDISNTKLGRYHVESDGTIKRDLQLSQGNMGDQNTLENFIEYGIKNYPADKMGLILWNHGGAMAGVCYDENYNNDCLMNSEISGAMKAAFASTGRKEKFEWIGYDACLMAVQDIADFNSNYFNYMVCSQESEAGDGYDYDNWVDNLYDNVNISTVELLTEIADTFIDDNGGVNSKNNDQTQSVISLPKMKLYREAWEDLAYGLASIVNSSSKWSTLKTLINKSQKYGYDRDYSQYNGGYVFDVFDAEDFIDNMISSADYSSLSSKSSLLKAAFNDAVIYHTNGAGTTSGGLSFFCPLSGASYDSDYGASETNFVKWKGLVDKFGKYYNNYD